MSAPSIFMASLLFLVIVNFNKAKSEDIIGCGGFIKSDVEINFSHIEVALYSKQGSLKYRTDCSPTNGYYMLPVYSRGEYILKVAGPKGWSFEPSSVVLIIDGETDACTLSKDINFEFTGFGVVGHVLSQGEAKGPKGVRLQLKTKDDKIVGEVDSGDDGSFIFEKVLPGFYTLEASHPQWKFSVRSSNVKVDKEVGEVEKDITVAGYPLKGTVQSNKSPVLGVKFLLYSKQVAREKVLGCAKENVPEAPSKDYLCHVVSDNNGQFQFESLIPGHYTLMPLYQSDKIKYEIKPSSFDVVISHDTYDIEEPFQVSGFMVSGQLMKSPKNPEGISGAVVMVNGVKVTSTDSSGSYQLEGMKSGTYVISFVKEGYVFEGTKAKVSPNDPHLPHLYPQQYKVCGRIILTNAQDLATPRKVIFSTEDSTQVASVSSDEQGVFCTHLPPAFYSAYVETTAEETKSGFKLMPPSHKIQVVDEMLNDITFSQFHATVTGAVKCLESCGTVKLVLNNLHYNQPHSIQEVSSDGDSVQFVFDKVMTGNYEVRLDNEDRCWKTSVVPIVVVDRDVDDVVLEQVGLVVQVAISVPATLHFKPLKEKRVKGKLGLPQPQKFHLKNKVNKFCVDSPGGYEVVVESCHQFEHQQYFYDTADKDMLVLNAVSYPVAVVALAKPNHRIYATITMEDGTKLKLGPLKQGKKVTEERLGEVYEYTEQHWSKQRGEELKVEYESEELLFEPKTLTLHVDPELCPSAVARVLSREGVFVTGSIKPPLSGVEVTMSFQNDVVVYVKTDSEGIYKVGPVDGDLAWQVSVAKRGYNFAPVSDKPGHFLAFKLAEIVVKVTESNKSKPLSGVLISLSGSEAFRKSYVTEEGGEEDDAGLVFSSLDPGEYFLKPMMKEYIFHPSHQSISLKEGATVVVNVQATRVSYSCFGSVAWLSGEPEAGVYIEAVSIGEGDCADLQEESKSEADGSFRIRGLKPGCTYDLRMKVEAGKSDRTSPKKITIQVGEEDTKDVKFIVFKGPTQADVTGRLDVPLQYLSSLKMHIYSENDLDSPLHVQSLAQSPFFFFSVPIHKTYILRLVSTLKTTHFDYVLPELKINANQSFQHFIMSFKPQAKVVEVELKHSSLLMLPLTIIIILAAYNYAAVLKWINNHLGSISNFLTPSSPSTTPLNSQSTPIDSISKEDFIGDAHRRKVKAKKI